MLPAPWAEEVGRLARQAAVQAIDAYGVTRAEVLDLVAAMAPPPHPDDAAALQVLLPWLARHRGRGQVLAVEIVALALADPDGAHVREAIAAELAAVHPAKAVGRLLKRNAWRPVAGFYVRAPMPAHRRDSTLYCVESCA
jgi:hypothetical protein